MVPRGRSPARGCRWPPPPPSTGASGGPMATPRLKPEASLPMDRSRTVMALINNEEAAKRLARVILSDIELYNRERPQAGENLDARIEEGRKLFGSRVAPEALPLFDVVLTDRRAASAKTPPATLVWSTPGMPIGAATLFEDPRPTPPPVVAAPALAPAPASAPLTAAAPAATRDASPSSLPLAHAPIVPPPRALGPSAPPPSVLAGAARHPDVPTPVLTSRISIPKLLALMAVVVGACALLGHFVR